VIRLGGDIIVGVDDMPIATLANLYEALEDKRPGESVVIRYIRDGRERESVVDLSERPEQAHWD